MLLEENHALVVTTSRRHAIISSDLSSSFAATIASKALDLTIGDIVEFHQRDSTFIIDSIVPRKNILSRTYRGAEHSVVANLDRLFIVSALNPLYNTLIIDRIATVAESQGIPCSLIVNKIDLGVAEAQTLTERYSRSGINVLLTSAKLGQGIDLMRDILSDSDVRIAALAGVSGVGKSSLLNRLVPEADQKTANVSKKTGQGRQTTSQPLGFLYQRDGASGILLIDLPGMQNFGVTHLTKEMIAATFPEIVAFREDCQFGDCAHTVERLCGVKNALVAGKIPQSRYDSYVHMLNELEQFDPY